MSEAQYEFMREKFVAVNLKPFFLKKKRLFARKAYKNTMQVRL